MEKDLEKSPTPSEPERPAGGDFSPSPGSACPICKKVGGGEDCEDADDDDDDY